VAFVVLLPILAYTIWDYVESRRLESRLDAIRRRGEPTSPLYQPPAGDFKQAERFYRAAAALLAFPDQGIRPDPASIRARNEFQRARLDGRWTPDALELARAEVTMNREALTFVDRAARLPFAGFLGGTSYNYQVGNLLRLARLCELRAAVAANDGDGDAALASFASEASLVRPLDDQAFTTLALLMGPSRFAGLSATMEKTRPSPAARQMAARAFADVDRDDRLRQVLLQRRVATLSGWPASFRAPETRGVPQPWSTHERVRTLDDYAALLAVADQPWPQRIDAMVAVGAVPFYRPSALSKDVTLRQAIAEFTKSVANGVKRIRCARLLVSPAPLDLIDPITGRRLEMLDCHL